MGWTLTTARAPCIGLVDMRPLDEPAAVAWLSAQPDPACCVFLGVECGLQRARLLERGSGDALPALVGLAELAQRARRLWAARDTLPRRRECGPLTLDLLHRDARVRERWLALHPREFELLWRLAERPGEKVSRARLLREVWRLDFEPGTNTVEVHVSRLRTKLTAVGLRGLVETDPRGGYRVAPAKAFAEFGFAEERLCA